MSLRKVQRTASKQRSDTVGVKKNQNGLSGDLWCLVCSFLDQSTRLVGFATSCPYFQCIAMRHVSWSDTFSITEKFQDYVYAKATSMGAFFKKWQIGPRILRLDTSRDTQSECLQIAKPIADKMTSLALNLINVHHYAQNEMHYHILYYIWANFPVLTYLDVRGNSSSDLEHLHLFTSLRRLSLRNIRICPGMRFVSLPPVERLTLDSVSTNDFNIFGHAHSLMKLTNLRHLTFRLLYITNTKATDIIFHVRRALEASKRQVDTLEFLFDQWETFNDIYMAYHFPGMIVCSGLKHLTIGFNSFGHQLSLEKIFYNWMISVWKIDYNFVSVSQIAKGWESITLHNVAPFVCAVNVSYLLETFPNVPRIILRYDQSAAAFLFRDQKLATHMHLLFQELRLTVTAKDLARVSWQLVADDA